MKEHLTETTFSEINLRDLYYVIFRHKKKIAFIFFTAVFITLYHFFSITDVYRSEASMIIKVGRESLNLIPTADNDRLVSVSRSQIQNLNTEVEILKSHEIFEKLVDKIGFETFFKKKNNSKQFNTFRSKSLAIFEKLFNKIGFETSSKENNSEKLINNNIKSVNLQKNTKVLRERLILHLMGNINIEIKRNTNIINISYEGQTPELANAVVSNIIDIYFEKHMDVHYSDNSYEFFKEQAENSQLTLNKIEKELVELKNELNVGSIDEYFTVLSNRIETIHQQIDINNTAKAESRSKIQVLSNSLESLPKLTETEGIVSNENTFEELSTFQLREQELLSKYTEENIQIKEIRRQIEERKKILNNKLQTNHGINTSYNQLQQDLITEKALLSTLNIKNSELNNMLSNAKQELVQLNIKGLEISQLEREREINSANYIKYSDNLEEANIDHIVQKEKISNITILQPATYPIEPVAVRKYRNIGMGIFLGLFGCIGMALILEYFDHSIKTQEDVSKRLRLKTLVVIPAYTNK